MSTEISDHPTPTYDPETDTYRLHPPDTEELIVTAVLAVAEIADVDPLDMDPVYEDEGFDVFDNVVAAHRSSSVSVDGTVSITIAGHTVTLDANGCLVIDPPA